MATARRTALVGSRLETSRSRRRHDGGVQIHSDAWHSFPVAADELWEAMAQVGAYRQWWPWLRHFDADALAAGDRWEAVVQPPLPYRVRFTIHLDEVSPAEHIVARILGDIAGSARVDGTEAAAAVGCPSDPPSTPGTGALLAGGSLTLADAAAVDGVPPVAHDSLATGARADSLARWVDALLAATPPALLADSLGAATPVVRVTGSLVAPHGSAAGVLVVDGDLTLDGDFAHEGVVVVRGAVTAGGAGVELRGTLIALGAGPHAIAGDVRVLRSRCAVRRALAALTMLEPLRERAWSEVW